MSTPVFVGIDVSKAQLDIALRPEGRFVVPNDEAGWAQVVKRLRAAPPTLVVLEATGGLEIPLTGALAAAGLPVVVVNPRHVRDFAKAAGKLAKTDALDAQVLAHFAEVMRPEPRPLPDEQTQTLAAILTRRRQLVEMLTAEKNRLASARKPVRTGLRAHITWLERELAHTDRDLAQAIRESPVW
ncbi:MAG: IS110 family transposase, partial [Nitrospiraceae bacterium]